MKSLNLKNMIETYKCASHRERAMIYSTFENMTNMGYISSDTWLKFRNEISSLKVIK